MKISKKIKQSDFIIKNNKDLACLKKDIRKTMITMKKEIHNL